LLASWPKAPTVGAMADALERFWTRRAQALEIGAAASRRIRQLVPADPARTFSDKLKALFEEKDAGLTNDSLANRFDVSKSDLGH